MKKYVFSFFSLTLIFLMCISVNAAVEPKKDRFEIVSCCTDFEDAEVYFNLSEFIKTTDEAETVNFSKADHTVDKCAFSIEGDRLIAFPSVPAKGTVTIEAKSSDGSVASFDIFFKFEKLSERIRNIGYIAVLMCILAVVFFYFFLFIRKYKGALYIAPVDSSGEVSAESVAIRGFRMIPVTVSAIKKKAGKNGGGEIARSWSELNLNGFFYSKGKGGVRFIPYKPVYILKEDNSTLEPRNSLTFKSGSVVTVYSDALFTRGAEIKFN